MLKSTSIYFTQESGLKYQQLITEVTNVEIKDRVREGMFMNKGLAGPVMKPIM